jgi:hypothetical protein
MNAVQPPERDAVCGVELVDLVDFKWLMTAEGHAVQVDRLQRDPDYAGQVFAAAGASANQTLRRIAAALQQRLAGGAVQAP